MVHTGRRWRGRGRRRSTAIAGAVLGGLVLAACTSVSPDAASDATAETDDAASADGDATVDDTGSDAAVAERAAQRAFGEPPTAPDGPLDEAEAAALDALGSGDARADREALDVLGGSDDPRLLWVLSDMLRFSATRTDAERLLGVAGDVAGRDLGLDDPSVNPWTHLTDHAIAWDLPAPPGYVAFKERLFTGVDSRWGPFFADEDSDVDWRLVSWGGVFIDDRELGQEGPCLRGCIPALDDPEVTDVAGGDWYEDDRLVFGVVVDGEARAYPQHQMQVHEMVNDTVGGRRLAIPYCTLCGSAQAWVTGADEVALPDGAVIEDNGGDLVMRTSGLLSRSNKVMYELATGSVFDTFRGVGLSGPLRGLELEQVSVVVSSWGEWKQAHPDTTIVARDGGIGRVYADDPLGGRDDEGPIFPVGDVDPRLPIQEQVLGVRLADGTALAFPAAAATTTLSDGGEVTLDGVEVRADAGGLRAYVDGTEVPTHQSFWFAWSHRNPDTALWTG